MPLFVRVAIDVLAHAWRLERAQRTAELRHSEAADGWARQDEVDAGATSVFDEPSEAWDSPS
jgi:hypothetical protein